jgi:hypothetical protein
VSNLRAVDYAEGYTPSLPAKLKAARVGLALRYVGQPAWPKALRSAELEELRAAGISLGFIYETSAQWMKAGAPAGRDAAHSARTHLGQIGGPRQPTLYLAADWDVQPGELPAVRACITGATGVLGPGHVGIYGGLRVVRDTLERGLVAHAWQTTAWSGGKWDSRAGLRQLLGKAWGNLGLDYDADEQMLADVGQWPPPAPAVKPYKLMEMPLRIFNSEKLWNAAWPNRAKYVTDVVDTPAAGCVIFKLPLIDYQQARLWPLAWVKRNEYVV